jgi:hypothetical protein
MRDSHETGTARGRALAEGRSAAFAAIVVAQVCLCAGVSSCGTTATRGDTSDAPTGTDNAAGLDAELLEADVVEASRADAALESSMGDVTSGASDALTDTVTCSTAVATGDSQCDQCVENQCCGEILGCGDAGADCSAILSCSDPCVKADDDGGTPTSGAYLTCENDCTKGYPPSDTAAANTLFTCMVLRCPPCL